MRRRVLDSPETLRTGDTNFISIIGHMEDFLYQYLHQ